MAHSLYAHLLQVVELHVTKVLHVGKCVALLLLPSSSTSQRTGCKLLSRPPAPNAYTIQPCKRLKRVYLTPCAASRPSRTRCDAAQYPIGKKKITMEFLREKVHLRVRTNTIAALARIRNCLAYATHEFFQSNSFLYVHTPIITTADCEGAGEMFQV